MTFSRQVARDMLDVFVGKASGGGTETNGTIYVGLSTTTPNEAGGSLTEIAGNGYSRVAVSSAGWTAASNTDPARIDNASAVTFPQASGGNWGLAISAVLFDAASGGNFLGAGTINGGNGLQIDNGDTAEFQAGDLAITLT